MSHCHSLKELGHTLMSSINTNTAAMTALQNLNSTNRELETTQDRISTGLRVNSASDNAAYWSIATSLRSDNSALSTVQDALGLGAATIDVADNGLTAAIDVATEIKDKLVAARQPGIDRSAVQEEITELQKQLKSISDSASFSGQNYLSIDSTAAGGNTVKSIVSSFANGEVSTIDFDVADVALFDGGASSSESIDRWNVAFAASGDLATNVATFFDTPATGDTANVTLVIDGSDQAATATRTATGYSIEYVSYSSVDNTDTGVGVQVKGFSEAPTDIDFSGAGVVTQVEEQYNTSASGILGKAGAASGRAIADFDANGNLNAATSIDIGSLTDSAADLTVLDNFIKDVDSAISSMTSAGASLGAVSARVDIQTTFVSSLMDSIDKGVGSLVDADMTAESSRLQALQTQQQLGVQSLSIANSSSQNILSLFR